MPRAGNNNNDIRDKLNKCLTSKNLNEKIKNNYIKIRLKTHYHL